LLPVPVEGETEQDKGKADGRAAGILKEDADGQRECAGDEDSGNKRIAGAAVGTRHVGFGLAQAEKRYNGKSVEDPTRANEEARTCREGCGERDEARQHAGKNKRTAGSEKLGMNTVGDAEEKFVARDGVRNARAAEDGRIERSNCGNYHGQRDPDRSAASRDM